MFLYISPTWSLLRRGTTRNAFVFVVVRRYRSPGQWGVHGPLGLLCCIRRSPSRRGVHGYLGILSPNRPPPILAQPAGRIVLFVVTPPTTVSTVRTGMAKAARVATCDATGIGEIRSGSKGWQAGQPWQLSQSRQTWHSCQPCQPSQSWQTWQPWQPCQPSQCWQPAQSFQPCPTSQSRLTWQSCQPCAALAILAGLPGLAVRPALAALAVLAGLAKV